jgi:hypothetical protein
MILKMTLQNTAYCNIMAVRRETGEDRSHGRTETAQGETGAGTSGYLG